MQISKISTVYNAKSTGFAKGITKRFATQNTTDTFEKSKEISFGASLKDVIKYSIDWGYDNFILPTVEEFDVRYPRQRKLNILNGDDNHLKNVAESLCMYTDEDVENFTKIYYPFHFDVNQAKSQKAFVTIMPYIQEQRTKLVNLLDIKEKLEDKRERQGLSEEEENGLKYTIEELERIDRKCREARSEYLTVEHLEVSEDDNWQID